MSHFAGISRAVQGEDGQALQHFAGQSPWSRQAVFDQIQSEIRNRPIGCVLKQSSKMLMRLR